MKEPTCTFMEPAARCTFLDWAAARGLEQPVCRRMAGLWRENRYRKGDTLFYQGNMPQSLYFLCSGAVKLVRADASGRQHILRLIAAGDVVGERALLAGQLYAASAQVMEDSRVCALEAARFRELWEAHPELPRMFARLLALKLKEADAAACDLALHTIRELLCKVIANRLEAARSRVVELSESRQELADLLGTSPEVVSRTLCELERKGLVSIDGRRLKVLDHARLRAAARLPARGHDFYQGPSCLPSWPSDGSSGDNVPAKMKDRGFGR